MQNERQKNENCFSVACFRARDAITSAEMQREKKICQTQKEKLLKMIYHTIKKNVKLHQTYSFENGNIP